MGHFTESVSFPQFSGVYSWRKIPCCIFKIVWPNHPGGIRYDWWWGGRGLQDDDKEGQEDQEEQDNNDEDLCRKLIEDEFSDNNVEYSLFILWIILLFVLII